MSGRPIRRLSVKDVDATELLPGLWQGGLGDFDGEDIRFVDLDTVVVLCPGDGDGVRAKGLRRSFSVDLTDSPEDLDKLPRLKELARRLSLSDARKERVGIFCWQGRNRSGLLMALTIRRRCRCTGGEAMEYIQSMRADALSTETGEFERYLEEMD